MGAVYLVERHEAPGALLALKVIKVPSPQALERFRREAQILTRLGEHPNLVKLHAYSEQGATATLLLDYVPGEDLSVLLRKGTLRTEEALRYGLELADALAWVHARGVLHRDLKPSNVIVDSAGRPRLLDFGVALAEDLERLTRTGSTIGTPAYFSPEQAQALPLDERSDVYSLGATLFHCLTGQPPLIADNHLALIGQIVYAKPQSASSLVPALPRRVDRLFARVLAKDPDDRPQSAQELREELEACLEAPPERRWIPLVALGLVALLLVGAGLVWAWQRRAALQQEAARLESEQAFSELKRLREAGDAEPFLARAEELAAELGPDQAAEVRSWRLEFERARIEALFARGELKRARALLGERAAELTPAGGWRSGALLLALNEGARAALPLAPPGLRARLAAWEGTPRPSWDPEEIAYGGAPKAAPPSDPLGAGQAALARGEPALAAPRFLQARLAAAAREDQASLGAALAGLGHVALARGDLLRATRNLEKAWRATRDPLRRAQRLGWWLQAALALDEPQRVDAGAILERAKSSGAQVPALLQGLRAAARVKDPASELPGAPTLLARARLAAKAGKGALDLLREAGCPTQALEAGSFCEAELGACAAGGGGAPGLLLVRGVRLARAAELSPSPEAAQAAEALLAGALRLRPDSPLGWTARARAALVLGDRSSAKASATRAATLAPGDPLPRLLLARIDTRSTRAARAKALIVRTQRGGVLQTPTPSLAAELGQARKHLGPGAKGSRFAARLRLARAALLLKQALYERAEPAKLTRAKAWRELVPLVSSLDTAALCAARRGLARALVDPGPKAQRSAEAALAPFAQTPPETLAALRLQAACGQAASTLAARAFLALAGDLPALALLALRESKGPGALVRAEALAPRLPLVLLERARTLKWQDPGQSLAVARALLRDPSRVGRALEFLAQRLPGHPEPLLRALEEAREGPRALARCLVLAALIPRELQASASEPKRKARALELARAGYASATRALQRESAGALGHYLRALCLEPLLAQAPEDPGLRGEQGLDLLAALAGAPGSSQTLRLASRVLRSSPLERADRLLACGLLTPHSLKKELPARSAAWLKLLEPFLTPLGTAPSPPSLEQFALRLVASPGAPQRLLGVSLLAQFPLPLAGSANLSKLGKTLARQLAPTRPALLAGIEAGLAVRTALNPKAAPASLAALLKRCEESLRLSRGPARTGRLLSWELSGEGVDWPLRPQDWASAASWPTLGPLREGWLKLQRGTNATYGRFLIEDRLALRRGRHFKDYGRERRRRQAAAAHARKQPRAESLEIGLGDAAFWSLRANLRDPWGIGQAALSLPQDPSFAGSLASLCRGADAEDRGENLLACARAGAFARGQAPAALAWQFSFHWRGRGRASSYARYHHLLPAWGAARLALRLARGRRDRTQAQLLVANLALDLELSSRQEGLGNPTAWRSRALASLSKGWKLPSAKAPGELSRLPLPFLAARALLLLGRRGDAERLLRAHAARFKEPAFRLAIREETRQDPFLAQLRGLPALKECLAER